MSSGSSVPPPHPDRIVHDYAVVIAVQSALTFIASICVALRFIQQKKSWGFWWDDWTSLGALMLCFPLLASTIIAATAGRGGYHIWTYPPDEAANFFKAVFATELLYSASVSLSKLSVLFMYRRIFSPAAPSQSRVYLNVLTFLVFPFWLASALGVIFTTSPVYAQWQQWLPHTMINIRAFYVTMATVDALLDMAILAFPQTKVWHIRISKQQKTLVSLVFLLGGFVCITSIARLAYLATYNEADATADLSNTYLWTTLEPNASVICSCLPILYKIFKSKDSGKCTQSASSGSPSSSYRRYLWKKYYSSSDDSHFQQLDDRSDRHQTSETDDRHSLQGIHVRQDFTVTDAP
ncbi:hypothetical protein GGR50DRAFT_648570 [Xylaria sp. CBS 124048]|nr:hypothetical protein GGR50DRAFT_648570 [Xylaria sp. CBS 124048]